MLGFHWMETGWGSNPSIDEIRLKASLLDSSGYESFLQVYHNAFPDAWIKSAHALNTSERIKFMIAVRPFTISPEYCAMMVAGFNAIQPDRLMLNIVHGTLHSEEDYDGIIDADPIMSADGKRNHTELFLDKLRARPVFANGAEILVAGASDRTIEIAKKYGDYCVTAYDNFIDAPERFAGIEKLMVNLFIVIRDTDEEAELAMSTYDDYPMPHALFGSRDSVVAGLQRLKDLGATDVIINDVGADEQSYRIHDLVKELSGGAK